MKRFLDLFLITASLPLLIPIIMILSLLVLLFMGRPIFYVQERPGLNSKLFMMYKFRSMQISDNDTDDNKRITKFGNFIRKSSLDELPELYNVLRGEMSLVGPRPLLKEYLPLYSKNQRKRHDVLPGITGWAQINGRNALTWEEKFKYDIFYVQNKSIILDIKILFFTFIKVFKRDGINAADNKIMSKFTGSKS